MRTHVLILSMAVLAAALPQASGAQGPGTPDSVVRAALARLQPGKGVRLHATGLGRLEGQFASLTDTTVALGTTTGPRSVAVAGIDSLWQRGSAVGTGALVGAVTLGLAGAVLGASAAEWYETDPGETAAAVGLIGVAGGALLGAVVGALIPTWKRKVP